jgi:hypothetical protein
MQTLKPVRFLVLRTWFPIILNFAFQVYVWNALHYRALFRAHPFRLAGVILLWLTLDGLLLWSCRRAFRRIRDYNQAVRIIENERLELIRMQIRQWIAESDR